MQDYYSAAEAIRRIAIPRSTFYYLVDHGEIPKVVLPLRKQAVYPKAAIDDLIKEQGGSVRKYLEKPENLKFILPTYEDLEQLIQLEKAVWGDVGLVSPEMIMARNPYNPESIHVLKDIDTNKVVGSITMSPLGDELIQKLINFKIDESDIKPEDYQPFTSDKPLDCYVVSVIACQDINCSHYAAALIRKTMQYLTELAEKGVTIRRIFTVANTEEGEQLSRKMGFTALPSGTGPLGDTRKPFVLNLEEKKPTSELIKRYKNTVKNRVRRAKRYEKTKATVVETSKGATDWIRLHDLPYVLALDYEVYGPESSVDPSITRTWWEKNPYACYILYNAEDRREVWGALTIIPMKEETIIRLLKGDLAEKDITAEDVLSYEEGKSYCGYVASTIIRPEHRAEFRKLMHGIVNYWCEHYPSIKMTKLYAYAFSNEGMQLIKQLFFSPRYDLDANAFELDLTKPSPSRLVREYQECIEMKK